MNNVKSSIEESSTPQPATRVPMHRDEAEPPPPLPVIRKVPNDAPIQWLKKGWSDFVNTRFQGAFYGLVFVLMGYAIAWVYATKWQLTMGLIGGFFLMGPFLCSGIYDLSRQYEREGKASLIKSLTCWLRNPGSLAFFAIILTFAMIVWARVSLILFALTSNTSFPTVQGVLQQIFSLQNPQFLLIWGGVGFVFASIVFAIGVIAAPMMLDRASDTLASVFSSVRSVHANPKAMYVWAALIVVVIGLSLAAGFIPLLITAPIIGHATWHAYRDLMEAQPDTHPDTDNANGKSAA